MGPNNLCDVTRHFLFFVLCTMSLFIRQWRHFLQFYKTRLTSDSTTFKVAVSHFVFYPCGALVHTRWLAWSCVRINAHSIVLSHDHSYDAVASSYNTRFCCTTNAPGRKTCRKIYYISLHNAPLMTLHIVRAFVRAIFFMRTFIKQIANFFARTTFWSHPIVQQLWRAPQYSTSEVSELYTVAT